MRITAWYRAHMFKRTTIEIDADLLASAKEALGATTTRATVDGALRRLVDTAERTNIDRRRRQERFLIQLGGHVDADVFASGDMWR